jgi:hypothetical protein
MPPRAPDAASVTAVEAIARIEHPEAMELTAVENGRFLSVLQTLVPPDWSLRWGKRHNRARRRALRVHRRPPAHRVAGWDARPRQHGFVLTGKDLSPTGSPSMWPLERPPSVLETSMPGVFAAGDIRHRSVKRVAAAVGEGSTATLLVREYLDSLSPERGHQS